MSGSVSVVIPCYAQAHYLPEAIESVLGQTLAGVEVVVVDDGSPDDVAAAVARYPSVRLIRQDNAGVSAARNHGLRETSGAFVSFLDADDRLLPHALEVCADELRTHPEAGLVWGFNHPMTSDGRVGTGVSNPWPRDSATYEDLLRRNVVGPPAGVVFRRSVLEALGGFANVAQAAEDWEMYMRVARRSALRCLRRPILAYRLHGANMSRDADRMLRSFLEILDEQVPFVGRDPRLGAAWREGRRAAYRLYDGEPRVEAVREAVRRRSWGRALVDGAELLVRYPSLFVEALVRRARRTRDAGS